MSKIEKILEKWKHGKQLVPKEEVFAVLNKFFPGRWEHKSGSHVVVRDPLLKHLHDYGPKGELSIPIKSGRKVKPIYLKELLKIIEYLYEMGSIKEEKEQ
jgi:hypothetical protein